MALNDHFNRKAGCKVKICGTTNCEDAQLAADEGADYAGVVVEVDFSPRSLTIEAAKELFSTPPLPMVALIFNMPEKRINELIRRLKPFAVQFLSQESPQLVRRLKKNFSEIEIWQSIHLSARGRETDSAAIKKTVDDYFEAGIHALLFDTVAVLDGKQKFGGTGLTSDWEVIRLLMAQIDATVPVYLAGGIYPENVAQAIETIHPDGIDLCSGVEAVRGKKDPLKVKALMQAVRSTITARRNLD
jgi:phosphoribosylanthranilate isomerase